MRNSSSLDWLRFMHTPNDYRVSRCYSTELFIFEYFYSILFSHDLLYFDFFPCSTRIVAYANVQLSHDIKAVIDKILCSILLSVVA